MRQYSINDILGLINEPFELEGEAEGKCFTNLRPVLEAEPDSLVFVSPDRQDRQHLAEQTRAAIIICDNSILITDHMRIDKCYIKVKDPKLVFARIGNTLFKVKSAYEVHPTAYVHPEAQLHPNTYVGPFTYLGRCTVDEGTIIYGHVYIYDGVSIGKNVLIHAGCVIGVEGFGYLRNEKGEYENFPHIGGVVIEDDVEIGANTCVDRGALGNTIISQGAKIDNLVHIAHNVVVGKHALVIADAMVGGGTVIGDHAWISPSSVLRDQIRIGDRALVGLGTVVTKNVPEGEIWIGSPARPLGEFLSLQRGIENLLSRDKQR